MNRNALLLQPKPDHLHNEHRVHSSLVEANEGVAAAAMAKRAAPKPVEYRASSSSRILRNPDAEMWVA